LLRLLHDFKCRKYVELSCTWYSRMGRGVVR
jgi:hypothetical protein